MNKRLLATLISAVSLTVVPTVCAQTLQGNDAGFFVGANAGQGYYNGETDLRSNTYSASMGYRWGLGGRNSLGVEAGYVQPDTLVYSYSQLKSRAVTLGATYHLTFGGSGSGVHGFFAARLGYMHWKQDETGYGYSGYGYAYSADGTGSYAGVGIGINFNRHVGLGLYYDYYLADLYKDAYGDYYADGLSVPSLGLEVRF